MIAADDLWPAFARCAMRADEGGGINLEMHRRHGGDIGGRQDRLHLISPPQKQPAHLGLRRSGSKRHKAREQFA